jgi:hypothetical protein
VTDPTEPVTIRCAACGEVMLTVSRTTTEAFSSGSWLCSAEACHHKRAAARAAAEGRLT